MSYLYLISADDIDETTNLTVMSNELGVEDMDIGRSITPNEIAELEKRVERIERIFNVTIFNVESDDISMLELAYSSFQNLLITNIKPTDEECQFKWTTLSCSPICYCDFLPKFGDYTIGRMCRLSNTSFNTNLALSIDIILFDFFLLWSFSNVHNNEANN